MRALGKGSLAGIIKAMLELAWWALWLAAAALALGAAAYVITLVLIGAGVLDPTVLAPAEDAIRIPGISTENPAGASWPVAAPALLIGAVALGGSLVIVGRLKRLFANFTSGEPFLRENADHLRVIWIAMIAIEVARLALLLIAGLLITTFAPDVHGQIALTFNLSTWGAILILIVLAEVFREGARLREEQELTI